MLGAPYLAVLYNDSVQYNQNLVSSKHLLSLPIAPTLPGLLWPVSPTALVSVCVCDVLSHSTTSGVFFFLRS